MPVKPGSHKSVKENMTIRCFFIRKWYVCDTCICKGEKTGTAAVVSE
jgi:hypothetical protein